MRNSTLKHPFLRISSSGRAGTRQRGFNLLEVLIALLVLALGLLGLAALQNLSLRFTNESYGRTQATLMIYEIIDRMRANPTGVALGHYNGYTVWLTSPPAFSDCSSTPCNPAAMANYDVGQWMTAITQRSVLVQGAGRIEPIPGTQRFDISVRWAESETPDLPQTQVVRVQLP